MSKKKYYDLVLSCFDNDGNRNESLLLNSFGGYTLAEAHNISDIYVKELEAGNYNDLIKHSKTVAIEIEERLHSDGSLVQILEIPNSRTYKVCDLLKNREPELHTYDIVVTQTTTITGVKAPNRDVAMQKAQEEAWSHAADSIDAMVVSEDGDPNKGDIADHIMLSLKEVLALIPNDDIAGPKPSKLRKDILALAGLSDWAE